MAVQVADYEDKFANPLAAAHYGFIDDVILPHETRARLCAELSVLETKEAPMPRRKHGNPPL